MKQGDGIFEGNRSSEPGKFKSQIGGKFGCNCFNSQVIQTVTFLGWLRDPFNGCW